MGMLLGSLWQRGLLSTLAIAAGFGSMSAVQANPGFSPEEMDESPQMLRVSQMRDVAPDDWAFTALQTLVERHGCLRGYPDGLFRGDRPLSRYEFATGLNACLETVALQFQGRSAMAPESDMIARLLVEFEQELDELGARVDDLSERVNPLAEHQFSTTTKLEGELIVAAIGATGEGVVDDQLTLGDRLRLNLNTSFTSRDNLLVRLQASNAVNPELGTAEGSLAFAEGESGENNLVVDALVYSFPITEKLTLAIAANAGASDDFASTLNPLDGDGNEGALTRFGSRNPIYYQIEDKGVGLDYALGEKFRLSAGYLVPDANDASPKAGLFNGAYGAMGQLHWLPSDKFEVAFTYLNGYNLSDTGTGSNHANLRSLTNDTLPISSNSYGIEGSWTVGDRLILGGWVGYSNITALTDLGGRVQQGQADIWNWAATATFLDLFTEGATGGLIIGMEPKVTEASITLDGNTITDPDTSLHIEVFYQYPLSENILITPGLVWLTAPNHSANNEDIVIGTIRTLFRF